MQARKNIFGLSSVTLVILIGAVVKFALHLFHAPEYGFFGDELYTLAMSRHLAFGYVDLPPLVPALMALSRTLLGDSQFAYRIFPALAGAGTLVFICLITKEFGGKTFAVAISALGFIIVPAWLCLDSIFCYDSIDQLVLAGFLFTLVRFLRTGNRRLWLVLGTLAGIACMTKMTMLFLGPGFLVALLLSKYRRDLLTPWPWLGAGLCVVIVSPYLFWQVANHWPTLEYWTSYGTLRVYQASVPQYLINVIAYMNVLLLPLWLLGLYRIFRRLDGVDYSFLGILFAATLVVMFFLHASVRMLVELFGPLLAASAVLVEELSARIHWGIGIRAGVSVYLLAVGTFTILISLPILPIERVEALADTTSAINPPVKEFNGMNFSAIELLSNRLVWDQVVRDVAEVYNELPEEEQAIAGIYGDTYMSAGAVDQLGPKYGLPHAVSGHLTYYLWGPGYSWDVMLIITTKTNSMSMFFDECEMKKAVHLTYDVQNRAPYIFVCRKPKVSAEAIWSTAKLYR
jgi:hypothetical protein